MQMKMSEQLDEIAAALSKFQGEISNPNNDATNPQYRSKYSTLANVINTVKPILAKHGLSYIQSPFTLDDGLHIGITTLLMHSSGQFIQSDPLILPAFKLGKDSVKIYDAQAAGIAVSYGRRYSLSSILGISSEDDDDAQAISHNGNHRQQQSKPTGQQTPPTPQAISEPQKKKINVLVAQAVEKFQTSKENVYASLYKKEGIGQFKSITELTKGQASRVIAELDKVLGGES